MRNIKFIVAYDGTDFSGWQSQPGQVTVQGTIADVLEKLTQQRAAIQGAGRTDAGVHANGQVLNFKTESSMSVEEFQRACNALLPPTIRVNAAEDVDPNFHSRRDAVAKTYRYRIFRGRVVSPFIWKYVLQDSSELNFDAMAEAAGLFAGDHDFTSFAASTGSDDDDMERVTIRAIYQSALIRVPVAGDREATEEWVYVVRGRSFMRNMVRKMVGTLVEIGRGKIAPSYIQELFALRDRSKSGATVPPQGLCLESVEYLQQGETPPSSDR
ncbi:MAG TPA: tRNA pseudouridine(38-40) synthase TruA [Candidatus Saccharimonadales bacterium]|jgi:tRNA pseudouridine38-40 synthase|nr:tRNA pseudouridine(38-40) synthase TruA [Candidatus Saccharimonadales bacterium]